MSHSDVRCGFRPRRCGHIFAALLSGLLLGSGCGRSDRDRTGEFVAKVGPVTLTADELAAELDRRSRTGLPAIPPAELVEAWVHHQALLARAREAGLDRDPELRRRMERVLVARMEEPLEERLRNLESVTDAEVEEHFRTHAGEFESPEQVRVAQILFRVPPGRPRNSGARSCPGPKRSGRRR